MLNLTFANKIFIHISIIYLSMLWLLVLMLLWTHGHRWDIRDYLHRCLLSLLVLTSRVRPNFGDFGLRCRLWKSSSKLHSKFSIVGGWIYVARINVLNGALVLWNRLVLLRELISQSSKYVGLSADLRFILQAALLSIERVETQTGLQLSVPVIQLLDLHSVEIGPIIELEHVEYAFESLVEEFPLDSALLILLDLLFAHAGLVCRHGAHLFIAGFDSFQLFIDDQTWDLFKELERLVFSDGCAWRWSVIIWGRCGQWDRIFRLSAHLDMRLSIALEALKLGHYLSCLLESVLVMLLVLCEK